MEIQWCLAPREMASTLPPWMAPPRWLWWYKQRSIPWGTLCVWVISSYIFHLILSYFIKGKDLSILEFWYVPIPYSRGNTPLGTGPQVEIDAFSAFGTSHWGGSYWARGYAWAQGRHRVKVRVKTRRTLERWARSGWSRSIIYIESLIECTNSRITASPVFSCGNSWGSWNNSGGATEIRNRAALRMSRWGPTSQEFWIRSRLVCRRFVHDTETILGKFETKPYCLVLVAWCFLVYWTPF